MKSIESQSVNNLYAELIAIKPGFHELYIHDDFFEEMPKGVTNRDEVFRMLRCQGELENIFLDKLPAEINNNSYFSYAPCNVTEGPFVLRKSVAVSYFNEIRKIKSKKMLGQLEDNFHILCYQKSSSLDTREKLFQMLEKAKVYCGFDIN